VAAGVPDPSSPAEQELLANAKAGAPTQLAGLPESDRTITVEFLGALCLAVAGDVRPHPRGITIDGGLITGTLDLSSGSVEVPLAFINCELRGGVMFKDAHTRTIQLSGSSLPFVDGEAAMVAGDLRLDFLRDCSQIKLDRARVSGSLLCAGTALNNPAGQPLSADSITIDGSAFLRPGFEAVGETNLLGAKMESLDLSGASLSNTAGFALNAEALEVAASALFSDGFEALGWVDLSQARIGQTLDFGGATLKNPQKNGYALNADGIKVGGPARFRDGTDRDGNKRRFSTDGSLTLIGAEIGRELSFVGAKLSNPDGKALDADSIKVNGGAFFRDGFEGNGEINLFGAAIGATLDFSGAALQAPSARGYALNAEAIDVKGAAYFCQSDDWPFSTSGPITLFAAKVGTGVRFDQAKLSTGGDEVARNLPAIDLQGADIDGLLTLTHFPEQPRGIDLGRAHAGALADDETAWPAAPHHLGLDGFSYDGLATGAPRDASERLTWLSKQTEPARQPFEQLAGVYERGGDEDAARQIRVGMHRALRKQRPLLSRERAWSWLLDRTILYGYAARRSIIFAVAIILVGWWIFDSATASGAMRTAKPKEAPPLQPLVYSLDTFIPVIDFGQQGQWNPDAKKNVTIAGTKIDGSWIQRYLWLHIALGWIATTLAVAAFTGLVRH
jgi:hypothetical protein